MKTLKSTALFICLISVNAMVGIDQAVQGHLSSEFNSISSASEFLYLGKNESCDEVIDTYVVGRIRSTETAYSCSICLVNDGGIAVVDSFESTCVRD